MFISMIHQEPQNSGLSSRLSTLQEDVGKSPARKRSVSLSLLVKYIVFLLNPAHWVVCWSQPQVCQCNQPVAGSFWVHHGALLWQLSKPTAQSSHVRHQEWHQVGPQWGRAEDPTGGCFNFYLSPIFFLSLFQLIFIPTLLLLALTTLVAWYPATIGSFFGNNVLKNHLTPHGSPGSPGNKKVPLSNIYLCYKLKQNTLCRTPHSWRTCGRKSATTAQEWSFRTTDTGWGHTPTA